MATNDPSRTISIHGDKYTYDSNKKKWMSGKKEATAVTSAMLDLILKQLQPKQDEEVDSFVGTANIVPSGGGDKEYEKEQDRNDEKREKREEDALESTESPATKTEEQLIKPEPIASDRLVAPAEELKEQPPERKISSGMEALLDAKNNIVSMVKDRENWFKPEKRESLESVEDLSRSEKNRLEKRDEKEGTPFYKTKASQISQDFGTQFNKRLGERLPLLKLFSDKFDGESDADAVGDTGAAGGSTSIGGLSDSVVDSLKSIDEGVQDIIDILKENQNEEQKHDEEKDSSKEDAETEKEKREQEKFPSKDAEQVSEPGTKKQKSSDKIKSKLDLGKESSAESVAESVGETSAGAAKGAAGAAEGEGMLAGAGEAVTGAAEGAAGAAEGAGMLAGAGEAVAGIGAALASPEVLALAGTAALGYGAYELFKGDDSTGQQPASPEKKPGITEQTNTLNQAEEERKKIDSNKNKPATQGHTTINQNNNNTSGGSGGSGAVIPTAGNRNSLDLYYFAA